VNTVADRLPDTPGLRGEQIVQATSMARETGRRTIECLEEISGLLPQDFVSALGAVTGFTVAGMDILHSLKADFETLSFNESVQHECILFRDEQGQVRMVFGDPFNPEFRLWFAERVALPAEWFLAHVSDISAYLAKQEETMRAMDGVAESAQGDAGQSSGVEELSLRSISEGTSPVVKLVNSTLYDALKSGVSDIHLEAGASGLAIKYRMDGVLIHAGGVNGIDTASQVISRIKVMSELDIAERRVPQDGRFKVSVRGREVDFRVSVMPSIHGEDAVLRILDKQSLADEVKGLRLDRLGFNDEALVVLRRMSNEPYGMVLVTGPTGSGKTTTLYAAVTEINNGRDKIITIEDPVEYQLPGVLQIPVNEKKGLSFAKGLRSILRHDPDKILVGEIRDSETAQIAIQAALTGHLVFTTVHANNVFDVIGRFTHMGVDPYSFVAALNGVLAQRLIRLNCPQCVDDFVPDAELLRNSGLEATQIDGYRFRAGRGCGHCRGSGFKGRSAIAEILVLNDELREMIAGREPLRRIKEAARRNGTRFLRDSAMELARSGLTSLEEINRVTFVA